MGSDTCGQFASIQQFGKVEYGRYLIDGRGVPTVCYECRAVQGDVREYPPVRVTLPHEHVAFYDLSERDRADRAEKAEAERDALRETLRNVRGYTCDKG